MNKKHKRKQKATPPAKTSDELLDEPSKIATPLHPMAPTPSVTEQRHISYLGVPTTSPESGWAELELAHPRIAKAIVKGKFLGQNQVLAKHGLKLLNSKYLSKIDAIASS